jgi:hypothetical protein
VIFYNATGVVTQGRRIGSGIKGKYNDSFTAPINSFSSVHYITYIARLELPNLCGGQKPVERACKLRDSTIHTTGSRPYSRDVTNVALLRSGPKN